MSAARARAAMIAALVAAAGLAFGADAAIPRVGDASPGLRGVSGSIEVAHPGCTIRAKPVRDDGAPVTVRVERVGEGRSRVEYVGWLTGTHDLLPLLERTDGRPIEGLGPILVEVDTQLPPDAGTDLFGRIEHELRVGTRYRALMAAAIAAWLAVPAAVIARRALRRSPAPHAAPPARAPSVVERLLEEVARARDAEPSVDARARLELLLLQAVRGADEPDPAAAASHARTDARSARAVAAVERWLHAPTPGDRLAALAEVDALRIGPGGAA